VIIAGLTAFILGLSKGKALGHEVAAEMSGIQTNTRVAEKDIEIDDVVSSNIVVNVD